jgi:hypothetical protein
MAWFTQMRGNDILFMMGSDFNYANANAWFVNLDKLIHYTNLVRGCAVLCCAVRAPISMQSPACCPVTTACVHMCIHIW